MFQTITVQGAESGGTGIRIPGRPLKVSGWFWRLGSRRKRTESDIGHPRVSGFRESRSAAGTSAGVGWAARPVAPTFLPILSPELPSGLWPAAPLDHTLHPLHPSRSPPLRPASAPSLAAAECPTRHAAGRLESGRAGKRSGSGGGGAQPAREEGRGGRERGKGGPEGASNQPVGGDRQVSGRRGDGSLPLGS